MTDSLQAIVRIILEPLLSVPMPWRLLVVILILIPVISWLVWIILPWLAIQIFQLLFLISEFIGVFLLYPGYLFINNKRQCRKQPPEIYYFFDNLIKEIVVFFYNISQQLKKVLNHKILNKEKRWIPRLRWFILTTIILPTIWFIRPSIEKTQAGKLISNGVNFWYAMESWSMTGEWGLSPLLLSPEQFIKNYFYAINSGEYQKAWNLLSPHFKNKRNLMKNGYTSYLKWWRDKVEQVKADQIRLISNNTHSVKVQVRLRFLMKSNKKVTKPEFAEYDLVWNSAKGTWMFYD